MLCRRGQIYAVERWLAAGHPIQTEPQKSQGRWSTALSVAIESEQCDLVRLLLCNGYRLELEKCSPFTHALAHKASDIVDILFAWGADPGRADPYDVITTYDLNLIERFWLAGLDLWTDISVIRALAGSPSIKQLYGLAKRNRVEYRSIQRALDIALVQAVQDRKERGIALCLWAGADPHRKVPSIDDMDHEDPWLQSAICRSIWTSDLRAIALLKPDPGRDDFDQLFSDASSVAMVDFLASISYPPNWSSVIRSQLISAISDVDLFRHRDHVSVIQRIFELGGRLAVMDPEEIRSFRRTRKRISTVGLSRIIKMLKKPDHCDPAIFYGLFGGNQESRRARSLISETAQKINRVSCSPSGSAHDG